MGQEHKYKYDFPIDMKSEGIHVKVVRLVGSGKRVLEVGCATGYMSRVLREAGCRVVGIELDEGMAKRAGEWCERVIVGDLDRMDVARELGEERFDVVVAADVLEHLKDPAAVLKKLKDHLEPTGCVVASIPNVAHGSVRLALLGGRFPYSELGLLDRTHLRFFTRETVEELFEQAGFGLGKLERHTVPIESSEVPYDRSAVAPELARALAEDPEALTYQFLVVAYPLPRAEMSVVQQRMRELAEAAEVASRNAKEAERQADSLRQALEEANRRAEREAAELREAFEETNRRAERNEAELRAQLEAIRSLQERLALEEELGRKRERLIRAQEERLGVFRRSLAGRLLIGLRALLSPHRS